MVATKLSEPGESYKRRSWSTRQELELERVGADGQFYGALES